MGRDNSNMKVLNTCTRRIHGATRYMAAADALWLGGVELHGSDVVAKYQHVIDTREAVTSAQTALKQALKARASAEVAHKVLETTLHGWVIGRYGDGSQQAMEFGFVPKVHRAPSAHTKARATDLAKATRKARNTMGSRQRAHVKGVLPTTGAASSAPAVSTVEAPAPVATGTGSGTAGTGGGTPPR